mgnify:CR=1 FL=1
MRSLNLERGFTLLELLVVITIIGILASIGMVQYMKVIETSQAEDSLAIARSVAIASAAPLTPTEARGPKRHAGTIARSDAAKTPRAMTPTVSFATLPNSDTYRVDVKARIAARRKRTPTRANVVSPRRRPLNVRSSHHRRGSCGR